MTLTIVKDCWQVYVDEGLPRNTTWLERERRVVAFLSGMTLASSASQEDQARITMEISANQNNRAMIDELLKSL